MQDFKTCKVATNHATMGKKLFTKIHTIAKKLEIAQTYRQ